MSDSLYFWINPIFAIMKRLLLLLFISSLAITSKAQYGMDFGLNVGATNYVGEIGYAETSRDYLDISLQTTNFLVGGFYRYSFTQNIAAKIQINYLRLSGADSLSDNPARYGRNLSFRTDVVEIAATGEYNFFVMNDLNRRSKSRVDFKSYVFAGVGAAFFYPYAQYNDRWYYLRPLQTEGTENAYDEMTIAVPFGFGANLTFNKKIRLGVEASYRFTFTASLDDVSTDYAADTELPFEESKIFAQRSDEVYESGKLIDGMLHPNYYGYNGSNPDGGAIRGNPESDDGYFLLQFNLSFVIESGNNFYRSRYGKIINRRRKRRKF